MILRVLFFLILSVSTASAAPILYFSDIVNGPKSGLGDGLGEGAIVTIWGVGLGSSQSTSKVYVKDSTATAREVAYTYTWCNADGGTSGGGPSDLYTTHGMQEISFSIPTASADGAGKIYVVVGEETSNELDFYVRSTGTIRFVKTGGTDSGVGSWSSPWSTVAYAIRGNTAGAGDVVYVASDITDNARVYYGGTAQLDGSANSHVALVSYPGNLYTIVSNTNAGISNYYTQNDWWVFSKLRIKAYSGTIGSSANGRTIACEHTQPDGIEANGQSGAIGCTAGEYNARGTNSCDNLKVLGNYIHDYGGQTTSNKEHATYFSLRNDYSAVAPEVGWNRLEDNGARFGIHIYDEHECGEFTGNFDVHDNWIENQVGASINIGTQTACDTNVLGFRGTIRAFNNIIVNSGQYSPVSTVGHGVMLYGQKNYMDVKIYNNTFYGYGHASNSSNDVFVIWDQAGSVNDFEGTCDLNNNIFFDTAGYVYIPATYQRAPDNFGNNLWYSSAVSPPSLPAWDSAALNTDPLFTSAATGVFTLQTGSDAIAAGTDLSAVVNHDFFGITRAAPLDLGAVKYGSAAPVIPPETHQTLFGGSGQAGYNGAGQTIFQ